MAEKYTIKIEPALEVYDNVSLAVWNLEHVAYAFTQDLRSERNAWLRDYGYLEGLEDLLMEAGHSTRDVARFSLAVEREMT